MDGKGGETCKLCQSSGSQGTHELSLRHFEMGRGRLQKLATTTQAGEVIATEYHGLVHLSNTHYQAWGVPGQGAWDWLRRELRGRHVCLIGDSMMRQVFNRLASLEHRGFEGVRKKQGDSSAGPDECSQVDAQQTHAVCNSTNFVFLWDTMGESIDSLDPEGRCAAYLYSIGHHVISGTPAQGGYPWSVTTWAERMAHVMGVLRARGGRGGGGGGGGRGRGVAAWASMQATTMQGRHNIPLSARPMNNFIGAYKCPPGTWRLLHVILAFNQVADAAAANAGVRVVDFWSPSLSLFELAFDGFHYGDPVALALGMRVLQWLSEVFGREQA